MYFITCFEKIDKDDLGWRDIGCSRTFGYYDNFDEADRALRSNYGDMFETVYHYAVIEYIRQGIHPRTEERYFYKYNQSRNWYLPIEEPEEFRHCGNIAIG